MSDNNNNNNTSGGIGFAGLLTIVFIILKLCNVIAWSWWWVLSPIWISIGLLLGIVAFVFLIAIITAMFKKQNMTNKQKIKITEEYAALTTTEDRAKWLLKQGITAKSDLDVDGLSMVVRAWAGDIQLPQNYSTVEEAIAGGTKFLAEKAGL